MPDEAVLLDWHTAAHWSERKRPCRYCAELTHLRDEEGRPADKVCAEAALADEYRGAAVAYRVQGEL